MNPKINVSEQFWRVFCASRGLRTPLRLTGKTHLVAHPHGGRVLMLQYRENHLLKYPFQKSQCPPKKQERDAGSTYSDSIVMNTLQCTSCQVQACLTGFVASSDDHLAITASLLQAFQAAQ